MHKRGQSFAEYVVLTAAVITALVASQSYFKRGVQGHFKKEADKLAGDGFYSPGAVNSYSETTKTEKETSSGTGGAKSPVKTSITESTTESRRLESVFAFDMEPNR